MSSRGPGRRPGTASRNRVPKKKKKQGRPKGRGLGNFGGGQSDLLADIRRDLVASEGIEQGGGDRLDALDG